jgi:membrane protein YdbS with pleckstrin-like domain
MDLFTNNNIELSNIPRAENLVLNPIDPSYKKILFWSWLAVWGIVFISGFIYILTFSSVRNIFLIIIIAVMLIVMSFLNLWAMLRSFKRKSYALRENDIVYQSGWIIQRISVCPFNRIQHCSISANFFERSLGLAALSIYTAGTQGSDIKIPGLKESTVSSLRDFIMQKTKLHEQLSD